MTITRNRTIDYDYTAFGDSLTEASSGGIPEGQRWPARLGTMTSPPRLISNRGIGGETSTQIVARILASPSPPIQGTWIWMGRNDPSNGINQATSLANVQSAVAWCGANQRYCVIGVLPKTDGTEDPGSPARIAIDALNAAILALVGQVHFLSLAGMQDNPAYRNDGLHLNALGQSVLRVTYLLPKMLELDALAS